MPAGGAIWDAGRPSPAPGPSTVQALWSLFHVKQLAFSIRQTPHKGPTGPFAVGQGRSRTSAEIQIENSRFRRNQPRPQAIDQGDLLSDRPVASSTIGSDRVQQRLFIGTNRAFPGRVRKFGAAGEWGMDRLGIGCRASTRPLSPHPTSVRADLTLSLAKGRSAASQ